MSATHCALVLAALLATTWGHAHAEEAAPNQPQTYYVIPIKGAIGRHFTAGRMEACLKDAERLKLTVVVLELDTGGGDIYDAERIVDLIIAHKEMRFVAFVRKALSAGAPITLACEKIFVTESATIGGAVSYSVGEDGIPQQLPAEVAEKFQSIWRAVCRKAAEHGGHPSLLAEAMVDPAFALTMREENGEAVFERDGQGKVLKAKGRILTLTAREAVECGLAEEMVSDFKAVGQCLGMSDWQEIGGRPGVQAADAGGPEKSASDAFATPDSLYEMLYRKVVSLGLTDELTQIQEKKVLEDWTTWLDAQRLAGRRVQWTMTLVEAREGKIRLIPGTSVIQCKRMLENAQSSLESATGSVKYYTHDNPRPVELAEAKTRQRYYQQKVRYLSRLLRETKAYPIEVTAKCDNEPRVFHMAAWVSARSRDALTRVAPETEIALSGRIGEVVPYLSHDGVFLIEIILDQCELAQEGAAPPPVGDKDADRDCREWLSLARNYLRAGMPEKAVPYLKQVIEEYPDTEYAVQARELGQEALRMIKARSEQENTPPAEGDTAPDIEDKKQ